MYDCIVIGGGPAGIMAASTCAMQGAKVLLLEKNEKPGKKLLITGKGRCNITNAAPMNDFVENTPVNGRFLYSAFHDFTNEDIIRIINDNGVRTKVERGGRVFPESNRSADVLRALLKFAKDAGVTAKRKTVTEVLSENGKVVGVKTDDGKSILSDSVIIATGGKSYPQTGSTGDGYRFAEKLSHTVIEPKPSLVPLVIKESFVKQLMGLSLKNSAITITDENGKKLYEDFGEMIFTHFGVSGPMILSASSHLRDFKNRKYTLKIDLKPALSEEVLDKRILKDFSETKNKDFINSLDALLPQKMISVIIRLSGIDERKKVNLITKGERKRLVGLLKGLELTVIGTRDINEAIITSGGVKTSEINPKTMESRLVDGLYFAGEVIDVDAYTGGFNLQIAYSTGYAAGENAGRRTWEK